jgi:hypothetical protein
MKKINFALILSVVVMLLAISVTGLGWQYEDCTEEREGIIHHCGLRDHKCYGYACKLIFYECTGDCPDGQSCKDVGRVAIRPVKVFYACTGTADAPVFCTLNYLYSVWDFVPMCLCQPKRL